MPSLLTSEMQFHFMEVRPVFISPRCMSFHLTLLAYMHECVLANNLTTVVITPAMPVNITFCQCSCFLSGFQHSLTRFSVDIVKSRSLYGTIGRRSVYGYFYRSIMQLGFRILKFYFDFMLAILLIKTLVFPFHTLNKFCDI